MSELGDSTREKLKYFTEDTKFTFDDKWHRYRYEGRNLESATTFLKQFKKPFDVEFFSKKIAKRDGMTQSAVKAMWAEKGRVSRDEIGTPVHLFCERHLEGADDAELDLLYADMIPLAQQRVDNWLNIYDEKVSKYEQVANEVRIFDLGYGLGGTFDNIFVYKDKLYISDYKTNEKLTVDGDFCYGNKLKDVFQGLDDNDLNGFSIQTSIYRLILSKADIHIDGAFVIWLPPSPAKGRGVVCKDFQDRLRRHFDEETSDKKLYDGLLDT